MTVNTKCKPLTHILYTKSVSVTHTLTLNYKVKNTYSTYKHTSACSHIYSVDTLRLWASCM